jgi:hypothetical protein
MPTKEQAGHTSDCKMEGCESVPSCAVRKLSEVSDLLTELIVSRQLTVALDVLHLIQREWAPETKKKRICDPYTVITAALKKIDEFEDLKP